MEKKVIIGMAGHWDMPMKDRVSLATQRRSPALDPDRMRVQISRYLLGEQPIVTDFPPTTSVIRGFEKR